MRVIVLKGEPFEMGEVFGRAFRHEIGQLYAARVRNAIEQARTYGGRTATEDSILAVARRSLPYVEDRHPRVVVELSGIARGAGLTLERTWALSNLTDLRDVLAYGSVDGEGCSSFVVPATRSETGTTLLGQTWDLATDNMPFMVAVDRRPTDAPRTVCVTLVGCLSLIGLNECGLAVGTTNIRSTDSRPGVGYIDLIHEALRESNVEGAATVVKTAFRAGAHYYYFGDAADGVVALECTATRAVRSTSTPGPGGGGGVVVHCNHMVSEALLPLEAKTPPGSSRARQERLTALIDAVGDRASLGLLKEALADHEGGPNAICRHDINGISSNASVIMIPRTRRLHVVHGPACRGQWIELDAS